MATLGPTLPRHAPPLLLGLLAVPVPVLFFLNPASRLPVALWLAAMLAPFAFVGFLVGRGRGRDAYFAGIWAALPGVVAGAGLGLMAALRPADLLAVAVVALAAIALCVAGALAGARASRRRA